MKADLGELQQRLRESEEEKDIFKTQLEDAISGLNEANTAREFMKDNNTRLSEELSKAKFELEKSNQQLSKFIRNHETDQATIAHLEAKLRAKDQHRKEFTTVWSCLIPKKNYLNEIQTEFTPQSAAHDM